MKHVREKIANVIQLIFSYGIFICLFVGGVSFFGYLAAFFIGGEIAEDICYCIYKDLYPWLTRLSTTMIVLGLIKMYLCGEVALSKKTEKKNSK